MCAASVHPLLARASPSEVSAPESPAVRFATIMPTVSCHLTSVCSGSLVAASLETRDSGADAAPLPTGAAGRRPGVGGPSARGGMNWWTASGRDRFQLLSQGSGASRRKEMWKREREREGRTRLGPEAGEHAVRDPERLATFCARSCALGRQLGPQELDRDVFPAVGVDAARDDEGVRPHLVVERVGDGLAPLAAEEELGHVVEIARTDAVADEGRVRVRRASRSGGGGGELVGGREGAVLVGVGRGEQGANGVVDGGPARVHRVSENT